MSTNPGNRLHGLQPPLPLIDTGPDSTAPTRIDLVDDEPEWRLDDRTREVGRRGIAAARARLRSAAGRAA